jgi:hypothetical protein
MSVRLVPVVVVLAATFGLAGFTSSARGIGGSKADVNKVEGQVSGRAVESLRVSNGNLRGGKDTLHEGGARVPTIFNWLARLQPRVLDAPLHMVDIPLDTRRFNQELKKAGE